MTQLPTKVHDKSAERESFQYVDRAGRSVVVEHHEASADFQDVIGEMRYDGVRFRDSAPDFKHDPHYDPRYTQAYSERNAVAFLLAVAGFRGLDLHSERPPAPDVRVNFPDGSVAYVETAEVIESPSARLNGVLNYVNVGIARALKQDSALDAKIKGHYFGVRAWMTSNGKYDPNEILAEFLRFLHAADLDTLPIKQIVRFGADYPALSAIGAKYYYSRIEAIAIPRFDPDAHSFGPESLASQVFPILEQKVQLAAKYQGAPLWLALYMSDPLGVPQLSLDNLNGAPLDFAPFQKLLVGDQRSVLVYAVR